MDVAAAESKKGGGIEKQLHYILVYVEFPPSFRRTYVKFIRKRQNVSKKNSQKTFSEKKRGDCSLKNIKNMLCIPAKLN